MKEVAFTGTRAGMTEAQKAAVEVILARELPDIAHHGDCVGADAEFHAILRRTSLATIEGHPGPGEDLRAHCSFDVEHSPRSHFARNRVIVQRSSLLIAAPREMSEQGHGGNWYTVHYARRTAVRVIVVWPDGSLLEEAGF